MKPYIAFVAGRSGGHIIPALALATQYKNSHNYSIIFFSCSSTLGANIMADATCIDRHVSLDLDNPPQSLLRKIVYAGRCFVNLLRSLYSLWVYKPVRVISTGGYISVPVVLSAWLLKIPVELYELNAVPGRAVVFLASYSQRINCVYEKALSYFKPYNACQVAYPTLLTDNHRNNSNHGAGRSDRKKTILVLGGSQGSLFINQIILAQVPLLQTYARIIHQTGSQDYALCQAFYKTCATEHLVFAYRPNIVDLYNAADLIISRAGAGTLAEIVFFKKPAIIIPLETQATDHQLYNAQEMQKYYPHSIYLVRQKELEEDVTKLTQLIEQILQKANFQAVCQN